MNFIARMLLGCALTAALAGAVSCAQPAPRAASSDSGAKSGPDLAALDKREGFFTLYVDDDKARVLAELPAPDADGVALRFIYATGLTAGLGSNPIGLDRGAFDSGVIVSFRRIGDKIIAEQENMKYRASAERALEKRAVRESFARSFLWSGDIETTTASGGAVIDLSDFLTRDPLGVVARLKNHPRGGAYAIDAALSMPDTGAALAFPDNVEIDAFLTLTSAAPGGEARVAAADGRAVTLVQHHSFVRLPDAGYAPRAFDPRIGAIEVAHYDFSAPLDAPIITRLARRFRLQREDPNAASGPVKKPIVFYVDPGAPEQIRDALIDGALWWKDAFEDAGFEDAYRVELLPDGAHPFDIRYNMIQWTHRQTRGWSYGGGVSDPRTGEMLKANVILGSQRVRQDRMIFEGLAGAEKSGSGAADDPVEIALARIRQLSAHEVGHTLGFAHNFAASSTDRASVMDYPAPYVRPTEEGGLDFSGAYGVGVGAWDKFAAKWLYAEFPEGADEDAALEEIVTAGYEAGLRFVGDREARSVGTAHPHGAVWDNGGDPVATLNETMAVRRIALDQFGARALQDGRPLSDLNDVIVPIYLYHRYQTAAAAKLVGGLNFTYGVKGAAAAASDATPVDGARQEAALQAILKTIDPGALDLPDSVIQKITPQLGGFGPFAGGAEQFDQHAAPAFDVTAAADTAASVTLGALLHPARVSRLVEFNRRDPALPSLDGVLNAIDTAVFAEDALDRRQRLIAQTVQTRFVSALIALSMNDTASAGARAIVEAKLRALEARLRPGLSSVNAANAGHRSFLAARIRRHLERSAPESAARIDAPDAPPGSPIGSPGAAYETCWFCETGGETL
ncbi:MAG: zinc-dependent metalloprotease [Pseudomonadota bacterium]